MRGSMTIFWPEVMWVDQPAGVGFSTGIGTHNEQGVANNMFVFLVVIFWLTVCYGNQPIFVDRWMMLNDDEWWWVLTVI